MLFIRQASVSKSILSSVKKFIYCPIRGQKKKNRWLNPEYKLDQYMHGVSNSSPLNNFETMPIAMKYFIFPFKFSSRFLFSVCYIADLA